jgi:hypothetical protein
MFCLEPLSLCKEFVSQLNEGLQTHYGKKLSSTQVVWISLCITGILVTNSVCWQRIERMTLGRYSASAISKMFCRAKITWSLLLQVSIHKIFSTYGINKGVLAIDDTANKRGKKTSKIAKTHKTKDKGTGGYFNGQELVLLVLITDKVTLPVGFDFYEPQPEMSAWRKTYKQQKRQGIPKKLRARKPLIDDALYPNKTKIALSLISVFIDSFPQLKVQCIVADALYGSNWFFSKCCEQWGFQIISQVKHSQKVRARGKFVSIAEYFDRYSYGTGKTISIRGNSDQKVILDGARVFLKAHGCKRFIIALKYDGEENYRYLVASDLTWRLTDIACAYTLRWLVEVFIQDWKSYEGWCQLAKQQGDEGSSKGLILSLLTDHCLLLHSKQKALINDKLPALSVGSLRDLERANAIVESIQSLLGTDTHQIIDVLADKVVEVIPLRSSSKHMSGKNLGRLEPTKGLIYKKAA